MDVKFKRMSDESVNAYVYRMCKNKDIEKYDLTWREVGNFLNAELDQEYTESKYRKEYQAMQRGIDMQIEKQVDTEELIEEMELAKDELYKEQVKMRDKLREYRNNLRNNARFDNLQDTAIECAKIVSKEKPFILDKEYVENDKKVGVLLISDWHYGIVIDNFMNKHNKEILRDKVTQMTAETISFCKINDVKSLKILNLQDLINGFIHVSARIENEEDVITQVMEVTEILAEMIKKLAPHFESIEYTDTLDNHSRCTPNKKLSMENENFGRFIAWYLKPRLEELGNVKIISERFDDTISKVDILGETCFAVHGHNDRVATVVSKLTLMTRQIPMSIFLGHTHAHYEKDDMGVDVIVNGTLSGTDTYAKEIRLTGKPMQKLLVYEDDGKKIYRSLTKHIQF